MGRLLVVPTHATAVSAAPDEKEMAEQRERMKQFALRGLKNMKIGAAGTSQYGGGSP